MLLLASSQGLQPSTSNDLENTLYSSFVEKNEELILDIIVPVQPWGPALVH